MEKYIYIQVVYIDIKKKCKKKEEKKEEERLKNDIITSKDKEIAKLRKMLEDEKRMNKKKQEQMIEIAKNAGNKNTFNIQVFLFFYIKLKNFLLKRVRSF